MRRAGSEGWGLLVVSARQQQACGAGHHNHPHHQQHQPAIHHPPGRRHSSCQTRQCTPRRGQPAPWRQPPGGARLRRWGAARAGGGAEDGIAEEGGSAGAPSHVQSYWRLPFTHAGMPLVPAPFLFPGCLPRHPPVSASMVTAAVRPTPEEPRPVVETLRGAMFMTARSSWDLATPGSPTCARGKKGRRGKEERMASVSRRQYTTH